MKGRVAQITFFAILGLICLFLGYVVLFPLISQSITISIMLYSIGKLCGLIGFLFLSVLIISGDTARFFDRFFGMDKIIKFQRKFSLVTTTFILLHPIFFVLSDKIFLTYLIPQFAAIPLALGTISLYLLILIMICSQLYKRISHKTWQYIHILTYILFFLALYHFVNIGSDLNNPLIQSLIYLLGAGFLIGAIYRTNYKIKQRGFKCYVDKIKWETKDAFTLVLRPNKKFKFKAGQFCFLRIKKENLYARHPFTISSSPEEENLQFTMKITGRFTKIASKLKKGEEVIVDGPFGIFTPKDTKKDLVFIAGGIGITPFLSLIKEKLAKNNKQNILLLYGTKTKEDLVFKKELDKIKEKWFRKAYILSQEDKVSYEKGHIDREIIKKYVKEINNSLFYICGPEAMKDSCVKELKSLNVKDKDIFIESFFW